MAKYDELEFSLKTKVLLLSLKNFATAYIFVDDCGQIHKNS